MTIPILTMQLFYVLSQKSHAMLKCFRHLCWEIAVAVNLRPAAPTATGRINSSGLRILQHVSSIFPVLLEMRPNQVQPIQVDPTVRNQWISAPNTKTGMWNDTYKRGIFQLDIVSGSLRQILPKKKWCVRCMTSPQARTPLFRHAKMAGFQTDGTSFFHAPIRIATCFIYISVVCLVLVSFHELLCFLSVSIGYLPFPIACIRFVLLRKNY